MAYSKDDVITLVAITPTGNFDEYGQEITAETTRQVFCKVTSATRAEYFEARQTGLEPEFVFTTQPCNYAGETVVIYESVRYSIYRTYRRTADALELYAHKQVGAL